MIQTREQAQILTSLLREKNKRQRGKKKVECLKRKKVKEWKKKKTTYL